MSKIAVIGAGISGLTTARLLQEKQHHVIVFEQESTPGGLIRCQRINGSLFHLCGGHVFNSKRQDVLDWFWKQFDMQTEFVSATRHSVIELGEQMIPYPIENNVWRLDEGIQAQFYSDLQEMDEKASLPPTNFEEFLKKTFGDTLYQLYFRPYNEKIWRRDLSKVPLSWLEGKLPMPTIQEMRFNNANRVEEKQFVHSSFYYEKCGGSQFLANRLSEGIDIRYNTFISALSYQNGQWYIDNEAFDTIIFCGNIKQLPALLGNTIQDFKSPIEGLESHGTTSVFCEIDANPYSWVYLPTPAHSAHRIICTGNFSPTNNAESKTTATIEFTDEISEEQILRQLPLLPFRPKYIAHHYSPYTYPIQSASTRDMIQKLKRHLSPMRFYFTGRFADWEYYNMDIAMGAAMDLCRTL